ncbi:MAG: hypothetical protein ABSD99_00120 [Candidatus Bathyarchaeia archaeon]|jgi:hypothetical protein
MLLNGITEYISKLTGAPEWASLMAIGGLGSIIVGPLLYFAAYRKVRRRVLKRKLA